MILGGGVAVCLLLSAHRAVIFAIAQLSRYLFVFRRQYDRTDDMSRKSLSNVVDDV